MKWELIRKRQPEFGEFENSQSIYMAKKKKKWGELVLKRTLCVAEEPFYKNIVGVTHGINQPFQR